MKKNVFILFLICLFLIFSGCTASRQYSEKQPPEKKVEKAPEPSKTEIAHKKKPVKKAERKKIIVPKKQKAKTEKFFTRYNIHVMDNGRDLKAHYTNWIGPFNGHGIIPLNTQVIYKKWKPGFILKRTDTGEHIYFYFNPKHMSMSSQQYFNLITSKKRVLMSGFSKIDRKGVKRGKVYKGMSKEGVLASLGYPARHKTPSLKNKYWVYWQNKWQTRMIKFNKNDEVASVVE